MFIWEKEILNIENNKVFFIDWTEKEYTSKALEYIVTKEAKDATAFKDIVTMHIANDILELFKEHDVQKWHINTILNLVVHSHEMMFATAIGKAFGTYEEWKHPAGFEENVRMSDFTKF